MKYILRTDVMFEHVDREVLDATQEEALQIAQEAERFEVNAVRWSNFHKPNRMMHKMHSISTDYIALFHTSTQ